MNNNNNKKKNSKNNISSSDNQQPLTKVEVNSGVHVYLPSCKAAR